MYYGFYPKTVENEHHKLGVFNPLSTQPETNETAAQTITFTHRHKIQREEATV